MTFHYLKIDLVFYYIVIIKQMNRNSYVIPTSCFTSNAYTYYSVHTSSFQINFIRKNNTKKARVFF